MMAHSNYGAALEKQGVEITLIYSGSHKVDGNPYSHLPDDVRETLQSRMDATRQMFAQKVSAYTGLSVQAVLDTEAAVYSGQEAIDAGLADELVNSTDAITVMRDALDARKSRLSGGLNEPKRLNQQLFQPLLRRLTLLTWCQRRRAKTPARRSRT